MIKWPNTLSFRLTIGCSFVFAVLLVVAYAILYCSIVAVFELRMDEDLEEDISEFAMLFEQSGLEAVRQEISREVAAGEEDQVFLRVMDFNGAQLFSSDLSHWGGVSEDDSIIALVSIDQKTKLLSRQFANKEVPTRMIVGVIGDGIILHIGESTENIAEFMEVIQTVFSLMIFLVLPVSAGVGWFVATRAVRGIKAVSQAAADIERGCLDRRVVLLNPTEELQQLASAFNTMLDRIQGLIAEMREMTDNIAHDLRSPLARIRIISEMILSRKDGDSRELIKDCEVSAAKVIEECDRLLQMINTTLDVAEAEAGATRLATCPVDLYPLVNDACDLFGAVAEEKNITLNYNLENGCYVNGNIQYLQRMLANILDNAFKYTQPQGCVDVSLCCIACRVLICVKDTGDGIDPIEQGRVFERFYRCDQSRSKQGCGLGLGLSFSQAVAHVHGGDIHLSSEVGKGSEFTIGLPLWIDV